MTETYDLRRGDDADEAHAWASMEVTPELLVGAAWKSLDVASQSMFRVTRRSSAASGTRLPCSP